MKLPYLGIRLCPYIFGSRVEYARPDTSLECGVQSCRVLRNIILTLTRYWYQEKVRAKLSLCLTN
jgi:hypothetical protein